MRVVDLSGYMFSGKTAVGDILREIEGFLLPHYLEEFDLLRMPGGLIDLKHAVLDWSPIRTRAAVIRFDKLISKVALSPKFPQKLYTNGFGYAKRYPNILALKDLFLSEIKKIEWITPWPYDDIDDSYLETFRRKLALKFGIKKNRDYFLVDKDKFIPAAQKFVHALLAESFSNNHDNTSIYVTQNALEPFSPQNNVILLGDNALSITVSRDPRDIYATAISRQPGFNDNVEMYKRISGAHDVDVFINRYKLYLKNIQHSHAKVLRIEFKELILNYDFELDRIYTFLNINPDKHNNKFKYFDPKLSINNLDIWRRNEFEQHASDFEKIQLAFVDG
jgi:hypothetical protein